MTWRYWIWRSMFTICVTKCYRQHFDFLYHEAFDPFLTKIDQWYEIWNHRSINFFIRLDWEFGPIVLKSGFFKRLLGKWKTSGGRRLCLFHRKMISPFTQFVFAMLSRVLTLTMPGLSQCISARALSGASAVWCGIGWCWFEYNGAVSLRSFRSGS